MLEKKKKKLCVRKTIYATIWCLLMIVGCAPIVYSPHAQNEVLPPYNRMGQVHEFGATSSINMWAVSKEAGTVYVKTYPGASISLFQNTSVAIGELAAIGGVELFGFPATWFASGASGAILGLRPYAGLQYSSSIFTFRSSFSPIVFTAELGDGEWDAASDFNALTYYQLTMLLHNQYPSKNIFWGGIRLSPAAIGLVGGHEYSFTERLFLRGEYSALMRPPFSLFYSQEELESFKGFVHYLTFGVFTRVK